jgi:hypothetical protein
VSYFVGGALVVSTLGSAYSSNKASKEQTAGTQKGIEASSALAQQARADVTRLFDLGSKQGRAGLEGAFNFYKQAAPQRIAPVTQGYNQAIGVLGQGAQQANNAILGLPMDMGFTNQQAIQAPTGYMDSAVLPAAQQSIEPVGPQQFPAQQSEASKSGNKSDAILTAGGYAASPKDMLNPMTAITNPLGSMGFGDKITKNLDPISSTKKLLSKIF